MLLWRTKPNFVECVEPRGKTKTNKKGRETKRFQKFQKARFVPRGTQTVAWAGGESRAHFGACRHRPERHAVRSLARTNRRASSAARPTHKTAHGARSTATAICRVRGTNAIACFESLRTVGSITVLSFSPCR